jgi:hypothetical protein
MRLDRNRETNPLGRCRPPWLPVSAAITPHIRPSGLATARHEPLNDLVSERIAKQIQMPEENVTRENAAEIESHPQAVDQAFGFKMPRKNTAKPDRPSSCLATWIIASYAPSSGKGLVSMPLISRKSTAACAPVRLFPSK